MTRKFSYNWLKEFIQTDVTVKELAKELSLKSMTVKQIQRVKPKFKGVITAQILEITKHPKADKLKLAKLDAGRSKPTVVCGAPNIEVGQIVPLAPEGARLQNPVKEGKTIVVKKAKIRDVESRGMMCSQKELGLGDDHTGIMILPDNIPIGKPLAEVLPFDDYILEVEITSNRPDALSVVGLAREAAAALGRKLKLKVPQPKLEFEKEISLSVEVAESELCPRYQAVVMTDVSVGPSPLWLQQRLIASGIRPINNLVDITNYILLEYGQPMHVFDYQKISGKKIIIRRAKRGEKILALDGNVYKLSLDNLVIADARVPVAIAGVMGGEKSAATEKTKTIIFESANFEPVSVRKTARALNLHSESSDLFEKWLHPESTSLALLRVIQLTQKLAKGKVASKIFDVRAKDYQPNRIKFDTRVIKRHLGIEIEGEKVKKILELLGFEAQGVKTLMVTVPWWRDHDVRFDYDLIEEIARIYGYHNLPAELPSGEIPISEKDPVFFWEDKVKDLLVGLGFTEVYNYSMISKELIKKVGFSVKNSLKICNPLNEELEYMRPTLIAGILQNVSNNLKNFSEQKIFELSNVYLLEDFNDLPNELPKLTGAIISEQPFLEAKGVVELLLKKLGVSDYQLVASDPKCPLWQKDQALDVYSGKKFLGQFGMVRKNILDRFDIKKPIRLESARQVALLDFDFFVLVELASTTKTYQPIPEFPSVERDLAIVIDQKLSWQEVSGLVQKADKLITEVKYLSTFIDPSLGKDKKSLAFRMVFQSPDRTLKSEEVDEIIKKLIKKLEKNFEAKLR